MDKALSLFGPHTAQWFESCVGQPTRVQAEGWPAIARGETALIAAPTGTGKTLFAKVLADACGLQVIRIDLGDIVSEATVCRKIRRAFASAAKRKEPSMIFFD